MYLKWLKCIQNDDIKNVSKWIIFGNQASNHALSSLYY